MIKGRKNLSKSSIIKLCEALKLSNTESAYFENLVNFNQANNFRERNYFYEKLDSIRPTNAEAGLSKRIRKEQFEFYSKWYHVVIRSIIGISLGSDTTGSGSTISIFGGSGSFASTTTGSILSS